MTGGQPAKKEEKESPKEEPKKTSSCKNKEYDKHRTTKKEEK